MVTQRLSPPRFAGTAIAPRSRWWRLCLTLCVAALGMAGRGLVEPVSAQAPVVYVIPIGGIIDLGLAPFVQRTLTEAATQQAAAVVLEINTFGGRVDAAVLIRDALLRTPVRTNAFVNKRAISAGALIALATTTIAMAEGGTLGAATPVAMGAPGRAGAAWASVAYVGLLTLVGMPGGTGCKRARRPATTPVSRNVRWPKALTACRSTPIHS
jgi:membrane-bound ClpP family serine protease